MGRRAARATHLTLWIAGVLLYIVFVIPRWWVLTGDIPATAAAFGRIVAGLPIAAAAIPVGVTLQRSLKQESRIPELALRLRAWSAVLHVIAGVLIIATAVAEVWLSSQAAAPWLFGVYGGAGSLATLAALAFILSFPAEMPPPPPKAAKVKPEKKSGKAPKQRRTRSRGRKQSEQDGSPTDGPIDDPTGGPEDDASDAESEPSGQGVAADEATARSIEASGPDSAARAQGAPGTIAESGDDSEAEAHSEVKPQAAPETDASTETVAVESDAVENEAEPPVDGAPDAETPTETEAPPQRGGLGNKRPVGKTRHRLRR